MWSSSDERWTCDGLSYLQSPFTNTSAFMFTTTLSGDRAIDVRVRWFSGTPTSYAHVPFVIVRGSGSTNVLGAAMLTSSRMGVFKFDSGVYTLLASSSVLSVTHSAWNQITINDDSGTVSCYVNGVPVLTHSSTFLTGSSTVGVGTTNSVGLFRDFYCYKSDRNSSGSDWFPFVLTNAEQKRTVNNQYSHITGAKHSHIQIGDAGSKEISINGYALGTNRFNYTFSSDDLRSINTVLSNVKEDGLRVFIHTPMITTSGLPSQVTRPSPSNRKSLATAFNIVLNEDRTVEWEE